MNKLSLENSISHTNLTWRPLRHFNLYRFGLALFLLLFFYSDILEDFLGSHYPNAYFITAFIFLLSSLIYIQLGNRQQPRFESQVILATCTDILLITLMMHFSGGVSSALGMLLVINIAATGTFLRSRDSFLFAALASLAILVEESYSVLHGLVATTTYSTAGILGMVLFASSLLASTLRRRAIESEAIASQQAEDLLKLEKLNEHIIQNMRTGILVVNHQGLIRMANHSAEALLGIESVHTNQQLQQILPELASRLTDWQKQPQLHQPAIHQEQGLPDIQPGFRQLDTSSSHPDDVLIFLEDATQLNQRFQQMKLASLGRLTASIAHEIRNPLSAINHAAQLLNESELDTADTKLTQIITTQVQRLDKVIENVLQLSRQETTQPQAINLQQWLVDFKEEFCQSHQLTTEQLLTEFKTEHLTILFNPSHLHQVIDNLCSNAIRHHDKAHAEILIQIRAGYDETLDQPYLDIIDNGPGISQEQAIQIFDPFYTTSAKGTGLGLFISKEIIESNRAKIRYLEQPVGSCFRIHFLTAVTDG